VSASIRISRKALTAPATVSKRRRAMAVPSGRPATESIRYDVLHVVPAAREGGALRHFHAGLQVRRPACC
jgi:hypothetical protein